MDEKTEVKANETTNEVKEEKTGMLKKIQEKVVGAGKWLWGHKKAIAGLAGAAAAGAAIASVVNGGGLSDLGSLGGSEADPADEADAAFETTEFGPEA